MSRKRKGVTGASKTFVVKGRMIEFQPGPDWSLVYYDKDDDIHSSMAIWGQATILDALREVELSRTGSQLFGLKPANWQYKALYQDVITDLVRESLRKQSPKMGHIVWYLVLGTGDVRMVHTESVEFITAHTNTTYPEIPEGGTVDDYVEILGIAHTDTDPELIV